MNKIQELKARLMVAEGISALCKEQAIAAQIALDEFVAASDLGKKLDKMTRERRDAVGRADQLETELREAALAFHVETGERKPAVGVEIQRTTKIEFNMPAAIEYAQAHAPKLVQVKPRNLSTFRSFFKRQMFLDEKVDSFARIVGGFRVVLLRKKWAKEQKSNGPK